MQGQENYKWQCHCMIIMLLTWRRSRRSSTYWPWLQASGQLLVLIILPLAIRTSITQSGWAPEPVCTLCRKVFCLSSELNLQIVQFIVFSLYLLTFCYTIFFWCGRRGTVEEVESYHTLPPCFHCIGKGKVTPVHTINTNWGLAVWFHL